MSNELDPIVLEFRGVAYHVFASINEEHHDQVDFVRVVRYSDQRELDLTTTQTNPEQELFRKALSDKAWAIAYEQLPDIEWDEGDDPIDHLDGQTS